MIMSDFGTTGDGLVARLQVLAMLVEDKRPASEVCRRFTPCRRSWSTSATPAPRR
jgi:phosphoglucosamine mutase